LDEHAGGLGVGDIARLFPSIKVFFFGHWRWNNMEQQKDLNSITRVIRNCLEQQGTTKEEL